MSVFSFHKLDNSDADQILPRLFSILHTNMSRIAPTGSTYEEDKAVWLSFMHQQMKQAYPKMILMYAKDVLVGYFQYSISDTTLMVEEVEIKPEYQRTMLFYRLCRYLCEQMPCDVQYIESYVNKQNAHSLRINKKLGLEIIGENKNGRSWHLRGNAQKVKAYFEKPSL